MPSTKSVVLSCAGIGSRLGLGQTKALIDIGGRPLIHWQLELFRDVEDLRIVVGYEANSIINAVLEKRRDVVFVYNHNYFNTQTGASFYLGSRDANEYVIEWDGDLLVHPEDVKTCLDHPSEYVAYAERSSDEAVFVKTNRHGDVVMFSRENGDYEWTGPACLRKNKVRYTSGAVFNQIEEYLPMKGLKVRAMDIDTYDDYKRAVEFVKSW
jgi:choline kinase